MADTAAGEALTASHRRRQLAIRAALLADIANILELVDVDDVDHTWPLASRQLLATTAQHHTTSALASQTYYQAFRNAEGIAGRPPTLTRPRFNEVRAIASLEFVGRIGTHRALRAGTTRLGERLMVTVSGSAGRLALDGGRSALGDAIAADNQARGWRRVTGPNPCDFCLMLASRGAVYTKASASRVVGRRGRQRGARAVGEKYHDHCACTVEPVFAPANPSIFN